MSHMGKLAALYAARNMPTAYTLDGTLQSAVHSIVKHLSAEITGSLTSNQATNTQTVKDSADTIRSEVKQLVSALEKTLTASITEVVRSIGGIENQDKLKQAISALPDHVQKIDAIQKSLDAQKYPVTDLTPISSQLATISEQIIDLPTDQRPTHWVFTVNRDERSKLMESITVTAT